MCIYIYVSIRAKCMHHLNKHTHIYIYIFTHGHAVTCIKCSLTTMSNQTNSTRNRDESNPNLERGCPTTHQKLGEVVLVTGRKLESKNCHDTIDEL